MLCRARTGCPESARRRAGEGVTTHKIIFCENFSDTQRRVFVRYGTREAEMRKVVVTLDRPAYTGVQVIENPDPDGFPIFEDPVTSIRYRCLTFYLNADELKAWFAFGILADEDTDPLFFGFMETEGGNELGEFRRSEVCAIATCVVEYDAEWLSDIDPPSYITGDTKTTETDARPLQLAWIKIEGDEAGPDPCRKELN